ncbi:hypothetical protein GAPWKB11_0001 [Gilliamella apicola]|nr:hypothetical protein GAPWKB11_1791 [Gilliamella apicola]KFA58614.1 hypothetical protein GAPWKB11_1232 [Gilliamella apicola]KFA59258.1 hypothetical protein GAPWKB11_0001 [Gilliamella apicola]
MVKSPKARIAELSASLTTELNEKVAGWFKKASVDRVLLALVKVMV